MYRPFEEGAYIARNYDGRIELVNVYRGAGYHDPDMLARSSGMPCSIPMDSPFWEGWSWDRIPTYEEIDKISKILDSFTLIMRMAAEASSRKGS